jgi:hypothetical protein
VFQFAGQRSYRTLDGVLKALQENLLQRRQRGVKKMISYLTASPIKQHADNRVLFNKSLKGNAPCHQIIKHHAQ